MENSWGINYNNIIEQCIVAVIVAVILGILSKLLKYQLKNRIVIFIRRIQLCLFPTKFNIAISINCEDKSESEKYYKEINKQFAIIVRDYGLSKYLVLKDISKVKTFYSTEIAEKFVKNKDLDLLIWGDASMDGLKENDIDITKFKLYFTYNLPRDKRDKENQIGKLINFDINSHLATKNYLQILKKDSSKDVEIITNNLFDITLYIVGISSRLFGRIEISKDIFEVLYNKTKEDGKEFKLAVFANLVDCYKLIIFNAITNKIRNDFIKAQECCEKILVLNPNNYFGLVNLAYIKYKLGYTDKAKDIVDQ
ncbi:MAG: hypothetical protein PHI66_00035 [Candidatus Pacebacteria bacterium]|nr:hypothetical protein [Candidatus Paceibacterota bacterium]